MGSNLSKFKSMYWVHIAVQIQDPVRGLIETFQGQDYFAKNFATWNARNIRKQRKFFQEALILVRWLGNVKEYTVLNNIIMIAKICALFLNYVQCTRDKEKSKFLIKVNGLSG